jgi:hypothetical protein
MTNMIMKDVQVIAMIAVGTVVTTTMKKMKMTICKL